MVGCLTGWLPGAWVKMRGWLVCQEKEGTAGGQTSCPEQVWQVPASVEIVGGFFNRGFDFSLYLFLHTLYYLHDFTCDMFVSLIGKK